MNIDIHLLTEDELRDLHNRVTERLRMLQQLRTHGAMLKFSIGDRVAFRADGRRITGVLVRHNQRTVSVIADGGHRWNVSPSFLERADPQPARSAVESPIVVTAVPRPASDILARLGQSQGGRS